MIDMSDKVEVRSIQNGFFTVSAIIKCDFFGICDDSGMCASIFTLDNKMHLNVKVLILLVALPERPVYQRTG